MLAINVFNLIIMFFSVFSILTKAEAGSLLISHISKYLSQDCLKLVKDIMRFITKWPAFICKIVVFISILAMNILSYYYDNMFKHEYCYGLLLFPCL